jgi:hypothetical protein
MALEHGTDYTTERTSEHNRSSESGSDSIDPCRGSAGSLAEMAQRYTAEAVETLACIVSDSEAPASARISAASALLDRGHGKAVRPIEADHRVSLAQEFEDYIRQLGALRRGADGEDETPM